jgi:hypothetical protein
MAHDYRQPGRNVRMVHDPPATESGVFFSEINERQTSRGLYFAADFKTRRQELVAYAADLNYGEMTYATTSLLPLASSPCDHTSSAFC